jgi:hypothetical protein
VPAVEERRLRMGEQRTSRIERILRRVEEHVEEWRRRDAARHAEADAFRGRLWAEAAERERLLAEAIGEEEAQRESIEELTKQHRVISYCTAKRWARRWRTSPVRATGS